MSDKTTLGDRMKAYEKAADGILVPRMPIILRIDGKAFHTYTKGLRRPWDERLNDVMDITAQALCEQIQGAQIAYVQSDEISILVHGYKTLTSQAYFDGRLQKICSVPAAIAAATFTAWSWKIFDQPDVLNKASLIRPAVFDCRAYNVPEADVCNYFLWRQQDASRNSIQMLARSMYSHKECHNKNTKLLQEMCFQKGQNWNDLPTRHKRGRCVVRVTYTAPAAIAVGDIVTVNRSRWDVDNEIPIFSQDREYINKYLATEEKSDRTIEAD